MRHWAIGDVHGCAEELRQLLDRIDAHGADAIVLVGDLYTKGPDPAGVWSLVRDRGLLAVRGNHDVRLLRRIAGRRVRDAHAENVVAALDAFDPAWRAHLEGLPLWRELAGWTVVHASIDQSGDVKRTKERDFVARRRVPHDKPPDPFWWSVYRGDRRVVFGHDAARGLVQVHRRGQLLLAGLDTGCVYGGRLTAMRLEDGLLVQVHATNAYTPVVRRAL